VSKQGRTCGHVRLDSGKLLDSSAKYDPGHQHADSKLGGIMYKIVQHCVLLLCCSLLLAAQTATRNKPTSKTPDQKSNQKKDIDPLALKVLKAVSDPIRDAKTFSFRTRGTREYVGSNGQIITYFNTSEITVQRPDKLRVDFKGREKEVQLFYDGGQAVLYAPGPNLYATVPAPKTLDGVLDALEKRDVDLPVKNLLETDPYQSLVPSLTGAYVIGKTQMFDLTVHHLAFMEPKAAGYQQSKAAPAPHYYRVLRLESRRSYPAGNVCVPKTGRRERNRIS
jgi:Predicted periplasmic protein (DUF2092)